MSACYLCTANVLVRSWPHLAGSMLTYWNSQDKEVFATLCLKAIRHTKHTITHLMYVRFLANLTGSIAFVRVYFWSCYASVLPLDLCAESSWLYVQKCTLCYRSQSKGQSRTELLRQKSSETEFLLVTYKTRTWVAFPSFCLPPMFLGALSWQRVVTLDVPEPVSFLIFTVKRMDPVCLLAEQQVLGHACRVQVAVLVITYF